MESSIVVNVPKGHDFKFSLKRRIRQQLWGEDSVWVELKALRSDRYSDVEPPARCQDLNKWI